ncbi:MAG: hypothetical protein LBS90_08140 [Oscillospiraceae bacterium]|jgi:heme-degrading monooxygenase HmoA|nr:hypothetical protein [Oscillospiraceae bacterium]
MFINQVIWESEKANEAIITELMRKKSGGATGAEGLISTECWLKNSESTVGFAIVSKWESRENFKTYFATLEHGPKGGGGGERPKITKTQFQFEAAE